MFDGAVGEDGPLTLCLSHCLSVCLFLPGDLELKKGSITRSNVVQRTRNLTPLSKSFQFPNVINCDNYDVS